MTQATLQALAGLRDLTTIKWYIIPLLAIVMYIWTKEIKAAKQTGNWDPVFAALAVFGSDFFNETWNGWVMHFSQFSAVWTTPGDTALRTLVGWNIEIMFMFSIGGFIFYHSLSEDKRLKILGIPEMWIWAVIFTAFCVFVECLLNMGGHLVWEYRFWRLSLEGVPLIFLVGYLWFFISAIFVITRETMKAKIMFLSFLYSLPIILNVLGFGVFGWKY